jgi:hypothetical protein
VLDPLLAHVQRVDVPGSEASHLKAP